MYAGLKFAFKITFTEPDFLWNVNLQIATVCCAIIDETCRRLPDDYLTTAWRLTHNFLSTAWQYPYKQMTALNWRQQKTKITGLRGCPQLCAAWKWIENAKKWSSCNLADEKGGCWEKIGYFDFFPTVQCCHLQVTIYTWIVGVPGQNFFMHVIFSSASKLMTEVLFALVFLIKWRIEMPHYGKLPGFFLHLQMGFTLW